jgi:hypothetical protein
MVLKALKTHQYVEIAIRLVELSTKRFPEQEEIKIHEAGISYTSLMICFRMHIVRSMLLMTKFYELSPNYFPVINAYLILRTMFEIDINAHYISQDPERRANQFIDYGNIIDKKKFDKYLKHKDTKKQDWAEFINAILNYHYFSEKNKIVENYENVKAKFEYMDKKGAKKQFSNWANKSLFEMAREVDHEIEYDFYYSRYSDFVHGNIKLADRFLKTKDNKMWWSGKAYEPEVAFIFRDASAIFGCFLSLFGKQWGEELRHADKRLG